MRNFIFFVSGFVVSFAFCWAFPEAPPVPRFAVAVALGMVFGILINAAVGL